MTVHVVKTIYQDAFGSLQPAYAERQNQKNLFCQGHPLTIDWLSENPLYI